MQNHTYRHRLNLIFEKIGLKNNTDNADKKISCICISNRPHLFDEIIEKFELQTYENKN